ncbi:MOSC domain-containing protein [Gimesia aquarii]|uniref:MOSC domain protein n=1 Tax=Gimesia aquarii TaxID=2527964 RepID=A0A517VSG2_9PLAN|nr:MOSC N-terminal beta barrel domain-containing protein [Gimesia aquarii]QDT95910.1 MOSC domain protein [Gimesia aquarii]
MLTLTGINIFPIKSLGGIQAQSAKLTDRGLKHDRRWMLVDQAGKFLTQRTVPVMSQLLVSIKGNHLHVQNRKVNDDDLLVPMQSDEWSPRDVTVFADTCKAFAYPQVINDWFSERIGVSCELVFMPDDADRPVDPDYSITGEQVSFADGYPALMIGESSLTDLNSRLDEPVTMERFRPNLVFSGGAPYCEDEWKQIQIGAVKFTAVKLCARCVLTTVDPLTSEKGREPLKTLATYRKQEQGVMFGQNLLHPAEGEIKVGDEIKVIE